jgi:predicted kinase
MKTLYIVRGIPGSGKSTFAKELVEPGHAIEADMYFMKDGEYKFDMKKLGAAHMWCKSTVESLMKESVEKVAVSNTSTRMSEMKDYFKLAEEYGYRVFSVIVENRHGGVNLHSVPEETLTAMRERFEVKL